QQTETAAGGARAQLAAAIGVPLHALEGIRLSFEAFERPPPAAPQLAGAARRDAALHGRSDVRASLAAYAAAQQGLRLQIANRYPNLVLGPGYNYDFGEHKFLLNPSVDLPVFNQNQGPIAEALAQRRQAAAAFNALQARIVAEIDAAVAALAAAGKALAIADAYLADAQRREARVKALLRAGEADRPTLLAAGLETSAARLSRLDAAAAQEQAIGALEDALQQPLFEPEFRGFAPPPERSAPAS
ncbi:MAG: TolC family protein, partial [Thiohalocapsa sp.]